MALMPSVEKKGGRLPSCPLILLSVLSVAAFFALHQFYVHFARADAPYMDTLRLIHQLDLWHTGQLSWFDLWGPQYAHRGLINPLLLAANMNWFGLDIALANHVTGLVILAMAALLIAAMARAWPKAGRMACAIQLLAVMLVPFLLFSWSGFELLTLDLGLPLWIKNLAVVLYFAMHAKLLARAAAEGETDWRLSIALAILAPAMVLVVTMGWSYAFVCTSLAVQALAAGGTGWRLLWDRHAWWPVLALIFSMGLYVVGGSGVGDGVGDHGLVAMLPVAAFRSMYAIGSTWMSLETAQFHEIPFAWLALAGTVSALAAFLGGFARWKRGLFSGSLLPYYLLCYGGLTALSVSIARGDAGIGQVMASRYYMDLVLFTIGMLWIALEQSVEAWKEHLRAPLACMAVVVLGIVSAQVATYVREWHTVPYRAISFDAMNAALRAGVPNDDAAALLQSPLADARQGAEAMRKHGIGPFRQVRRAACDLDGIAASPGWYPPEGQGAWMAGSAILDVPQCGCQLSSNVYLPDSFPGRILTVLDPAVGDVQTIGLSPGESRDVRIPSAPRPRAIRIQANTVTIPARDIQGGSDQRELGVFWGAWVYKCDAVRSTK